MWKRAGYHELPEAKKTKVDDEMPRERESDRLRELNAELSNLAQRAISMAAATAAAATRKW